MRTISLFIFVFLFATATNAAANGRDQIGEVLGKPVYREQIAAQEEGCPSSSMGRSLTLRILFVYPVLEKYRETHRKELEPSEQEINQYLAFYVQEMKASEAEYIKRFSILNTKLKNNNLPPEERKELDAERKSIIDTGLPLSDRDVAIQAIKQWKLWCHFYKKYGGGRFIVDQMGGIHPFDSRYNWLREQEKNGLFKITDPKLREELYSYWTSMDHGSNLIDDKTVIDGEKIMEKILNPDWVTK